MISSDEEPARVENNGAVRSTPALELAAVISTEEPAVIRKGKGGRKPIYKNEEERKERNRQAQAVFREKRSNHIKKLETTSRHQKKALKSCHQSREQCLMLRYRNSLLERILCEKGIDVQMELNARSSNLQRRSGSNTPAVIVTSHQQHQASEDCHQQRRSIVSGVDLMPPVPLKTSFEAHQPESPFTRTFSPSYPKLMTRDVPNQPISEHQARHCQSVPSYFPSFQTPMEQLGSSLILGDAEQAYDVQEGQKSSDYFAGPEISEHFSPRTLAGHYVPDTTFISTEWNNMYQE